MERKKILINNENPIVFGDSAYKQLNNLIIEKSYSKILIISDFDTRKYCLDILESKIKLVIKSIETHKFSIEPGEKYKNLDSSKIIWQFLIEKGFKRNSLIINLGGGMITDLGGFVASVFMRGIDFVNIPTSLLGMVDASIGGKTGIDLKNIKNIIGSFYSPAITIIDTQYLDTLPIRQTKSGFSEIIKHCLIEGKNDWNKLKVFKNVNNINEDIIYASIKTKVRIVENDPKEKNIRKFLNFGHTIGHAIESFLLNTEREVLHGEAIAAGIVMESYLSAKKCDFDKKQVIEIKEFIDNHFDKIIIQSKEIPKIIKIMSFDKKNHDNTPNFVLIKKLGVIETDKIVSEKAIIEAFEFYSS
tara:strand:+ start:2443 stop:3519 length:1077 start_codon:yes stop_codon:yes gene_type:complete